MLKTVMCSLALAGLALAGSKAYRIDVYEPAYAGSTELKAGHYEVSVSGPNAVIHGYKVDSQNPVKVETSDHKYTNTAVKYVVSGGKRQIQEIYLGGTSTRLVFTETAPMP